MSDPKDPAKMVPGAFHGEGDTDAGVVTESIVEDDEAEDTEQSEDENIERVEDNEGVEPGP